MTVQWCLLSWYTAARNGSSVTCARCALPTSTTWRRTWRFTGGGAAWRGDGPPPWSTRGPVSCSLGIERRRRMGQHSILVWRRSFFKGLVAGCHSFCLFFIFYITYIHSITLIQYICPSPFAEASLHILIACKLRGKNLPVAPSLESNSLTASRRATNWPCRTISDEDLHAGTSSMDQFYTAKRQYRKLEKNIPRKGTARPQSQFLHSWFCERFISIPTIGSAYYAAGK